MSEEPGSQNWKKGDEKWAKAERKTSTSNLLHSSLQVFIEHLQGTRLCTDRIYFLVQERDSKR